MLHSVACCLDWHFLIDNDVLGSNSEQDVEHSQHGMAVCFLSFLIHGVLVLNQSVSSW